ncbi:MAG TPA: hypothetical protein VLZ75_04630 [Chitinophagales bacterium]|nr:hypothetical protein [Chitinophagales bacterium]
MKIKFSNNQSDRNLSDWQYQCLGRMGLGILSGSRFGLPGAIIGLGLGALSC